MLVYMYPAIYATLCACVHTQILRQHRKQSAVKSKPVEFNFQSSQIVGKVQRVTGKKWKASLEGSAQVSSLLALTMWLAHIMLEKMVERLGVAWFLIQCKSPID